MPHESTEGIIGEEELPVPDPRQRKRRVRPQPGALVGNAADANQVKEARRVEKDDDEMVADGLRLTVETRAGRHFLWRFLERGGIFKSSWQGDTADMTFQEGRREFALWLLALWTRTDPDSYLKAMAEHREGVV
jgi:hypothetical protein